MSFARSRTRKGVAVRRSFPDRLLAAFVRGNVRSRSSTVCGNIQANNLHAITDNGYDNAIKRNIKCIIMIINRIKLCSKLPCIKYVCIKERCELALRCIFFAEREPSIIAENNLAMEKTNDRVPSVEDNSRFCSSEK